MSCTDPVIATFNEKLLLGNGLVVSPLPPTDGGAPQRSMRDVVLDIDNDKDFQSYILNHTSKIPARTEEIQYKQHPVSFVLIAQPRHFYNLCQLSYALFIVVTTCTSLAIFILAT